MPADGNLASSELARNQPRPVGQAQVLLWQSREKLLVQPLKTLCRVELLRGVLCCTGSYFALARFFRSDMGDRKSLPSRHIRVRRKVLLKRSFDLDRSSVFALELVRVVGVHCPQKNLELLVSCSPRPQRCCGACEITGALKQRTQDSFFGQQGFELMRRVVARDLLRVHLRDCMRVNFSLRTPRICEFFCEITCDLKCEFRKP